MSEVKLSPGLKIIADAQTSQLAMSNAIKNALGNSRVLRCWKDANSAATDPAGTGTEFLRCNIVGDIVIKAAKIIDYGALSNFTIRQPADVTVGACVLRIEGNGHWVEYTLGGPASNTQVRLSGNITGSVTEGIALNLQLLPPPLMASGTGFPPPAVNVDTPAYVVIENWTNPNAVTEAGRIYFNDRWRNWVFEDTEYAANIGDVRVTGSTQFVTYGQHEFGAVLFSTDPQVGTVNGKVLHQVVCNFKPTEANWPNYPRQTGAARGGYRRAERTLPNGNTQTYGLSDTFMPPFKVRICRADGSTLGLVDMPKDNLPVNSPELSEVATKFKAIRPHTNCAQVVMWESHNPKLSTYAKKWYAGSHPHMLRHSLMKERSSTNAAYPMWAPGQGDSFCQWNGVVKWAQPIDAATIQALPRLDPYCWDLGGTVYNPWGTPGPMATLFYNVPESDYGSMTYGSAYVMGWGHEWGNQNCHDLYSGPGGVRFDRGIVPTQILIHLTDPNWVILQDNSTITERIKHWNMGYCNHSCYHWDGPVNQFQSVPVQEVLDGKWMYGEIYYNYLRSISGDLDRTIPMLVPSSYNIGSDYPHHGSFTDANYRMPWNGYSNDWFHNYGCPGHAALAYNSPAHALMQKLRYLGSIMAQGAKTKPEDFWKSFAIRDNAWLLLHEGVMWKLASDHQCGIPRAMIEDRIEKMLASVYNNITVPVEISNAQTIWARGIRNFGMHLAWNPDAGRWQTNSTALHYYMGHAMQLWRQFGLFKAMSDRSEVCRRALLTIIKMLDKGAIDYFLDTNGAYDGPVYGSGLNVFTASSPTTTNNESLQNIYSSWTDWQTNGWPKKGPLQDLIRNADGTFRQPDIGEFSRLQWVFIRKDYFPDVPSDRDIDTCYAKCEAWMNDWNTRIQNIADPRDKTRADWSAHPAVGRLLPPTILEP